MRISTQEHKRKQLREAAKRWRMRHPKRASDADRRHHYKFAYGIDFQEREVMLRSQGSKCKVCGGEEKGWDRGWGVDHCHTTGVVRGVLCKRCNLVLGHVKDSPDLLRALADYLASFVEK